VSRRHSLSLRSKAPSPTYLHGKRVH
jgi:hypothetical protein